MRCVDQQKAFNSVELAPLWKVFACSEVRPRMMKVIPVFYDGVQAPVKLDKGERRPGNQVGMGFVPAAARNLRRSSS